MKLLYTDIQFDMTEILTKGQLNRQKLISEFLHCPNSLSFEKEERFRALPEQASLQLLLRVLLRWRYFVLNEPQTTEIDDNGLAMIFTVPFIFSDTDLKVFGRLNRILILSSNWLICIKS